jgi:DNA-directed RNA polymerase subunit RPC12/RpoP
MARFHYKCEACAKDVQRIFSPEEAKQVWLCECGGILRRNPRPPTSRTVERLDNGFMTKAVERLSEAPRLFHEHAKGKKSPV